ncbi:MAG: glycosyltransferase [archaeon]
MTVLTDTSLCAIVRDEKMNPAGGVERFLRAHLSYVEEAKILDTGSTDGTRELLEQMEKEFDHLKVYDTRFTGYAEARNVSLAKVKTKWALVLDADELLLPAVVDDVEEIKNQADVSPVGFNFFMRDVEVTGPGIAGRNLHNPRIFSTQEGFAYRNDSGLAREWLYTSRGQRVADLPSIAGIRRLCPLLHFLPSDSAQILKYDKWYSSLKGGRVFARGPAKSSGFKKWKKLNPHRANYPG